MKTIKRFSIYIKLCICTSFSQNSILVYLIKCNNYKSRSWNLLVKKSQASNLFFEKTRKCDYGNIVSKIIILVKMHDKCIFVDQQITVARWKIVTLLSEILVSPIDYTLFVYLLYQFFIFSSWFQGNQHLMWWGRCYHGPVLGIGRTHAVNETEKDSLTSWTEWLCKSQAGFYWLDNMWDDTSISIWYVWVSCWPGLLPFSSCFGEALLLAIDPTHAQLLTFFIRSFVFYVLRVSCLLCHIFYYQREPFLWYYDIRRDGHLGSLLCKCTMLWMWYYFMN